MDQKIFKIGKFLFQGYNIISYYITLYYRGLFQEIEIDVSYHIAYVSYIVHNIHREIITSKI